MEVGVTRQRTDWLDICIPTYDDRLCADPNGPGLIPDPEAKLEEPLVVRPTSETIIWNMFAKWIGSHRGMFGWVSVS